MLDHILEKIQQVKINVEPFPHFIISDFLPIKQWHSALQHYPDNHLKQGKLSSKSRTILESKDSNFEYYLSGNKILQDLFKTIKLQKFQNILLNKFNDHIPEDLLNTEITTQMDVTRATAGYKRNVHLDRGRHIISSMWYLNQNEDFAGRGGDLQLHSYKIKNNIYDVFPSEFEAPVNKQLCVERNSYVCWLACPWGYHSIVPLSKAEGHRKFVYIALNDPSETIWKNYNIQVLSEERRQIFVNQ